MAYIDWIPDYDLGIAELDRQHRRLMEIVNRLYDAVEQNCPKFVIRGVVCDLVCYAENHSACEEQVMQQTNFPGWKSHHVQHKALARTMQSFELTLAEGGTISVEMMERTRGPFVDLLICADREFSHYDQDPRRNDMLAFSC